MFIGGADIPHADLPPLRRRLVQVDRQEQLVLPSAADTMLVEKLVAERPLTRRHNGRGEDSFVFGKGLLGDERPREVQIAARPPSLGAQRANVIGYTSDLSLG